MTSRVQLQEVVKQYEHIFNDVPGNANIIEHEVKLTADEPIRSKPYTIPYNVRESLKKYFRDMINERKTALTEFASTSTKTWEQHLVGFDEVFSRLASAGFTARPTKCVLGAESIEFIPNYAAKAVPLSDLTNKSQPNQVVWSDAQEKAYSALKTELTSFAILWLPDNTKPFTPRTDASDTGLGAVLLQEHDGKLSPVTYASRKLTESDFSTTEL
ncbi:Hypothetical predicted protein [Paramuricea clavata]|uniref:Uncharacterized protein n=1 Tax=Paramuricea clavata TaxID=317549 RepID=A0A6S7FZS7_PARCT|nr:Hypothetical predicted protein [Paramuricea clavata]